MKGKTGKLYETRSTVGGGVFPLSGIGSNARLTPTLVPARITRPACYFPAAPFETSPIDGKKRGFLQGMIVSETLLLVTGMLVMTVECVTGHLSNGR